MKRHGILPGRARLVHGSMRRPFINKGRDSKGRGEKKSNIFEEKAGLKERGTPNSSSSGIGLFDQNSGYQRKRKPCKSSRTASLKRVKRKEE